MDDALYANAQVAEVADITAEKKEEKSSVFQEFLMLVFFITLVSPVHVMDKCSFDFPRFDKYSELQALARTSPKHRFLAWDRIHKR